MPNNLGTQLHWLRLFLKIAVIMMDDPANANLDHLDQIEHVLDIIGIVIELMRDEDNNNKKDDGKM